MKYVFSVLLFFLSFTVFAQPIVNRAGPANTVADYNLKAIRSFFLPRYSDTLQATQAQHLDTCGALISTYDNKTWQRDCNPKRWTEIGSFSPSADSITIRRDSIFIYTRDTVYYVGNLTLNPSDTADKWVRLIQNNATNDSIVYWVGSTRYAIKDNGSGGGGGTGTVTNVATGYGVLGGPITTTGTVSADSSKLATKLYLQYKIDSLMAAGVEPPYTTGKYLNGYGQYVTLNSDSLTEGSTNLFFTNARVRAALSAGAPLTYNSTTGAFGITQATTSTDGYLSSTDWNTFNNKQGAITYPYTTLKYYTGYGTFGSLRDSAVASISLATPNVVFATPVTFSNTAGAWSGTMSLNNQSSYTVFGNHTGSSASPTFGKLPVNSINATGSPSSSTYLRGDGSWTAPPTTVAQQTLTDGATITWDVSLGAAALVTIAGNRNLTISNAVTGTYYTIIVKQDATGVRTIAWPAGIKWRQGSAPTLTTTANAEDVITLYYNGTNFYGNYGNDYK